MNIPVNACDACTQGVHCFGGRCPCCCREPEPGKLAAIRGVLAGVDWEVAADRDRALLNIEQVASSSRTESGLELGGGGYLTPADLATVLDALDTAAKHKRELANLCKEEFGGVPCDACDSRMACADEYDALFVKLGGEA